MSIGALFVILALGTGQGSAHEPAVRVELVELAPCRFDGDRFAVSIDLRTDSSSTAGGPVRGSARVERVVSALVREAGAREERWREFVDPFWGAPPDTAATTAAAPPPNAAANEAATTGDTAPNAGDAAPNARDGGAHATGAESRSSEEAGRVTFRLPVSAAEAWSAETLPPGDYDVRLRIATTPARAGGGVAVVVLARTESFRVHLPDPSSAQECAGTVVVLAAR